MKVYVGLVLQSFRPSGPIHQKSQADTLPVQLRSSKMKSLAIVFLGLFAISLSACNTVEGAGKDVKATGNAVENAAKDAKPY